MFDLDDLSVEQLQDEVATLAAHIYAGTCRWLELVGELDRRGSWPEPGCGWCAEWLAWRCALLPRAAREHVASRPVPASAAARACRVRERRALIRKGSGAHPCRRRGVRGGVARACACDDGGAT